MSLSIRSALLPESLASTEAKVGNYRVGRRGTYPVDMLVIHVTEGDASSTVAWFNNPEAKVSAHYLVREDGRIVQFVDEGNTAFHAGRVSAPTAELVLDRAGVNPNSFSIGIEHEGDGKHEMTSAQRGASIALIQDICQRRSIPIDRTHIVGHHEIFALKSCPGAIDVDALVAEAAGESPEWPPSEDYPRVVYSPSLSDYLVVTRYAADDDWSFVKLSTIAGGTKGTKAGSLLSQMPARPA